MNTEALCVKSVLSRKLGGIITDRSVKNFVQYTLFVKPADSILFVREGGH